MPSITPDTTWTAFRGESALASGSPAEVALAVHRILREQPDAPVLTFDDRTGHTVDFDRRGSEAEIAARLQPVTDPAPAQTAPRRAGRPRLGVVAKEVTLLPRHWEWLEQQPGSASATLRRLVDEARKANRGRESAEQARAAADRFMQAALGDRPGYEAAARALYRGNEADFATLTADWPADLRDHAHRLAAPAFATASSR
ncbi:DUF2239 family protein [Algiphilus sp.]|uniref:DUF2239 family protein n=1 Tax=Algiphilus sp. TaxID=1872431 RepID=UPI003C419016